MKKKFDKLTKLPPWEWPGDAADILISVLRDKKASPADRELAAELSGEYSVIDEPIAETLLSLLRDPREDINVKCAAAISFGPPLEHGDMLGFDDPDDILLSEQTLEKVQKSLRKLYMDPDLDKEFRRALLEASVRAPRNWHHKEVRAAYDSQDEQWKLTAIFCMRFIPGLEDLIEDALNSENPDIYYHAVHAAGVWEVEAGWPHVTKILNTPDVEKPLLLAAITAAGFIRPEKAALVLEPFFSSEDEDIEEAVAEALFVARELFGDEIDDDFDEYDNFEDDPY